MATDIILDRLTDGDITQNADGQYVWEGTGIFDRLISAVNSNIKIEFDNGRITGTDYANVYLGSMQSVIAQATNFVLQEQLVEAQADLTRSKQAAQDYNTTNILPIQRDKAAEDLLLLQDTHASKVAQAANQAIKLYNEGLYVDEQRTQLINSVVYNNKIKALDSMSDTYGTFGAGGLTLSTDMWTTYFSLVHDLSSAPVPTSTTVTKVT
jgi:hypothetical protein